MPAVGSGRRCRLPVLTAVVCAVPTAPSAPVQLVARDADKSHLADANWLNERLPVVRSHVESVYVGPTSRPEPA